MIAYVRRLTRPLIMVPALLILASCRLQVVPLPDTPVESLSGVYSCENPNDCKIDVVDGTFRETFRAIPPANWAFTGWRAGANYLCSGRMGDCELSSRPLVQNAPLLEILESDDRFRLEPTVGRHFRELFEARYTGVQLEPDGDVDDRELMLEISENEERFEFRPDQAGTQPGCTYEGRFDVRSTTGRSAREIIEGTFSCNNPPFDTGTFTGAFYRGGHASLFVEIHQINQNEVASDNTYALVRDSQGSQKTPLIDCCIARSAGAPLNRRSLGDYIGGVAYLSTVQCRTLQQTRARSAFKLSRDDAGLLGIVHEDAEGADCSYQQDNSGLLQGSYQCDDGTSGVWGSAELKRFSSAAGDSFDLSFIQSPTNSCSYEVNLFGVEG